MPASSFRAALGRFRSPEWASKVASPKPAENKKIALLGLFGCDNYGNDGSLEAMIDLLRRARPEDELTSICVNPSKVERDHEIGGIPISWPGFTGLILQSLDKAAFRVPRRLVNLYQSIRQIRRFDAVIVPGTGILCDYRADPFGAPYWAFRWCVAAKLCGVKLFLVSVGAGPIHSPLSRWMLKHAARAACYRSFRDPFSRNFATTQLKVDTREDHVYPDIAFKLPVPATRSEEPITGHPVVVGVGVMWYNGWQGQANPSTAIYQAYLSKLARFAAWLLERRHRVRLLVGEITDERAIDDLRDMVRESGRGLPAEAELPADPISSLHELMQQIARTDIVVASRFHNVVCALKLARPTISIGYSLKHDELMKEVGLDAFCQQIEQLDLNTLIRQFTELLDNRPSYEKRIGQRVTEFRHQLEQQDLKLLRMLG